MSRLGVRAAASALIAAAVILVPAQPALADVPPHLFVVTPSSGYTGGGAAVNFFGSGFTGTTVATIGGNSCSPFIVNSDTTITCMTPVGNPGPANVTVQNGAGNETLLGAYLYNAPIVTSISPTSGPVTGGTVVTATGVGFTNSIVDVGGTTCPAISIYSDTLLGCLTPSGVSGPTTLGVSAGGATTTTAFTYFGPPTVTAVSPTAGPTAGGTSLVLTGTDLNGATTVTVGGAACTSFTVDSPTQITCVTPAGLAGARNVVVTTGQGTGTGTGLFTYASAPTITTVSPASGPLAGGGTLTVTGTDLTGTSAVTIGGQACTGVSVTSSTQVTCTAPAGSAGTANVAITTAGGTGTGTNLFTYAAAPVVSAASPSVVLVGGGGTLTLTGTGFTGTTAVTVGGQACGSITVGSDTQLTCSLPAGSPGGANIVVTATGGTVTAPGLFTFFQPAPVVVPVPTTTPSPTVTTPTPAPTTSSPAPTTAPTTPAPTTTPTTEPGPPAVDLALDLDVGEPVAGGKATLRGSGLHARSAYTLTMHSTPIVLASGYSDDNGSFNAHVTLPASACAAGGLHELALTGVAPDGSVVRDSNWLALDYGCVARSVTGAKPLARTVTFVTVRFAHDSRILTPYARSVLRKSAGALRTAKLVTVAGYTETDQRTPAAVRANRALSLRRAQTVVGYLRGLGLKVPMVAAGRGGVDPLKGRPQSYNRRVTITVRY